jgi:DNA-binding transcriptional MerR regulator
MNTSQAAAELGTTPRALRAFLRKDPTYRNAGSGGRYDFEPTDIPVLRKRFEAAKDDKVKQPKAPRPQKTRKNVFDGESSADRIHPTLLRSRDPKDRAMIKKLAEERVDRLEAALKARGLHISQSKANAR